MSDIAPLIFNGLDATQGTYLSVTTEEQLSAVARKQPERSDKEQQAAEDLNEQLLDRASQERDHAINANTRDLAETGWGVIFAYDADLALYEALRPLLAHRQAQATRTHEHFYREFRSYDDQTGRGGYLPGETKVEFCHRHGANVFGVVDPHTLPYYLLIVGEPEDIPYEFQYQLGVQYAVGRVCFDTIGEYAQYAQNVVVAETTGPLRPRRAAFFGVRNDSDEATITSSNNLVRPLGEAVLPAAFAERVNRTRSQLELGQRLDNMPGDRKQQLDALIAAAKGWELETYVEQQTYKNDLARLLGGPETPTLLFTASHGVAFPKAHPLQREHQGGLVCQDWPGPRNHRGVLPPDYYFAADDLASNAQLNGMLAFFFACYGGGTPRYDEFAQATGKDLQIASQAFVARLPQRMLGRAGGALAAVAHVERTWGYSFMWERDKQLNVFKEMLTALMVDGEPVGAAMDYFGARYAEVASELSAQLDPRLQLVGKKLNHRLIARLWTTNNDARSYIILGDPAVRLPVGELVAGDGPPRVLELHTSSASSQVPAAAQQPARPVPTKAGAATTSSPAYRKASRAISSRSYVDNDRLAVATYVSNNLGSVRFDPGTGQVQGSVQLRALSQIDVQGNIQTVLPEQAIDVDPAVREVHNQMVAQVMKKLAELLDDGRREYLEEC